MTAIIKTEYNAYDKVKKYKGKRIRYISKRKFKSLGFNGNEVRGFFAVRKAKTEQTIVCHGIPFDLREKKGFCRITGYVKGENGGFYAMTTPLEIPCVLLLIGLLCLFCFVDSQPPATDPWIPTIDPGIHDSLPNEDTDNGDKSIQINGFTDWSLPAGKTENLPIALENPKGNPCYFTFSIVLSDGTVLYESGQVPPGNRISAVTINQPLSEGQYDAAVVITTNDIKTGTSMNSAQSKIKIHAFNESR